MLGLLFIEKLGTDPREFFAWVIVVVVSITLHELAHGWAAIRHGDDTPIVTGHMTLNPLVHMGTFSLILLALTGIAFGAMPIDPTRMRGKYAEALVALAGPVANLLIALVAAVALGLLFRFSVLDPQNPVHDNGIELLWTFAWLNVALMLFNLLPFPPLDGSHIVANLIPAYRRLLSSELAQGAMTALFFALFLGGGLVIVPAAQVGMAILIGLVSGSFQTGV